MTTSALNSALSGLRVAQKALDVTSSNISNAGVEGYTKKTLPQESINVNGIGIGVRFGEVQRYVDQYVQRDYSTQLGVQSYLNTRENYLSRITALNGSTDGESNISAQLGKLYDSFVTLSGTPDSTAMQSAIVAQAATTARSMNILAQQMLAMRNQADQQIKAEVTDLNTTLQQVAALNRQVKIAENTGQSTAALQDQRDQLVQKVAGKLDISYFTDGDNVVVLQTKAGQVLADSDARSIDFSGSALTYKSVYPDSARGVVIQGLGNAEDFDLAGVAPGGTIGALLNVRDKDIPAYTAQLDELAHKLMTRLDDQGMRLFSNKDGIVPVNDPTQYAGLANEIQVNPLVLADPSMVQKGTTGAVISPASNAIVMNIVNFAFGKYKDAAGTLNAAFNMTGIGPDGRINVSITGDANASLLQFSNAILDNQANDYNNTKTSMDNETQYIKEVQTRLLNSSAVNSDEELVRMMEFQKSYSANAKMISTLDELFRDLLNAI